MKKKKQYGKAVISDVSESVDAEETNNMREDNNKRKIKQLNDKINNEYDPKEQQKLEARRDALMKIISKK